MGTWCLPYHAELFPGPEADAAGHNAFPFCHCQVFSLPFLVHSLPAHPRPSSARSSPSLDLPLPFLVFSLLRLPLSLLLVVLFIARVTQFTSHLSVTPLVDLCTAFPCPPSLPFLQFHCLSLSFLCPFTAFHGHSTALSLPFTAAHCPFAVLSLPSTVIPLPFCCLSLAKPPGRKI